MSSKPTAEIHLVNLALLQLYQAGVTSLLDSNSPVAKVAVQQVAPSRRKLLRNHVWNFAKKRDTIPKIPTATAAPKFDYTTYYQLPNDLVRLLTVGKREEYMVGNCVDYDIEGRYLLTNTTDNSLPITYIKDEVDVNLYDALFVDALVLQLAMDLCLPITGSDKKLAVLQERFKDALAEALVIDHQERPVDWIDRSRVQDVRDDLSGWGDLSTAKVDWSSL